MSKNKDGNGLYLGVDVGATKTYAALVDHSGTILARKRLSTPAGGSEADVVSTILSAADAVLAERGVKFKSLAAVGVGVPGVVDPDEGRVVVTPNMSLQDSALAVPLQEHWGVPVALANDVNLGTLGEKWLGAAQFASDVVGIFVGTGIGGGVVVNNRLVRGCRQAAGEIGHMVMQVGGPVCGCGNQGCLEALASRTAIERDIREAVAAGRSTVVSEAAMSESGQIRSGTLRMALDEHDLVVTEVVARAAEVLGYACLTVRHLLDPDTIVFGGGLIEACGDFMLPIIKKIVASDQLRAAGNGCRVVRSILGDDAVVLGAVVLAQESVGHKPLNEMLKALPKYPNIVSTSDGEIRVGKKVYGADIYIREDGKIRKRDKAAAKEIDGTAHAIGPKELEKISKGSPELLVIGTGQSGLASLTPEGEAFLKGRGIALEQSASPAAVQTYNQYRGRKAALFHITC